MVKKVEHGKLLVQFYPVDISYDSDKQEIRLFGVTKEKKQIIMIYKSFFPYFYAVIDHKENFDEIFEKVCLLDISPENKAVHAVDVKYRRKTYLEKDVNALQIFAKNPAELILLNSNVRRMKGISLTSEYDIPPVRRFLIDKKLTPFTLCTAECSAISRPEFNCDNVFAAENITSESDDFMPDIKIFGFDIETTSKGSFPDPKTDPIIMISFYGSNGYKKSITWKKFETQDKSICFVDGEYSLLEEIKNTLKSEQPQILVGFNSDAFDIPFIFERMKKYNIEFSLSVDSSEVKKIGGKVRTFGIIHIDILQFIMRILSLKTSRLTLNSVASELIGKTKLSGFSDPNKLNSIWEVGLEEELVRLCAYNLQDSLLAYEIYLELLPTQLQLVKLISLPIQEINRMNYGMLVEWYLIKNASAKNQIVPKRPSYSQILTRQSTTYTGGYVISPKPGLYSNICVFDFRSLYPSIIASHNISPETLNCKCCRENKRVEIEDLKIWFCEKHQGFISSLIRDLIERRTRIKDILNKTSKNDKSYAELKARQYALKTIANSMYGYMGFANSKWYCLECAKAITALGRKYIQMTIKEFTKAGFNVLYADTDSVFVVLEDKTKDEALRFLKVVNSVLRKPMELEYEAFYPSGLFLEKKGEAEGAKKRYALLTENKELVLKGLEAIRGDWSKIAKDTQIKVLEIILKDKDVGAAEKYVQEVVSKLKSKKVEKENLIIQVKLTKSLDEYSSKGPHVIAGELYAQRGYSVGRGFLVSYIVKAGKGKRSDKIALPDDPGALDYDVDYYIENQVMRAVFKIFEIFGYGKDKLSAGQTTLANY